MFLKIKDFDNYSIDEDGICMNEDTGHILKPKLKNNGYYQIGLRKDKKRHWFTIHRLVAITHNLHNPKPDIFTQVDHIDDDKNNNSLSNLQWISGSLNCRKKKSKTEFKGVKKSKTINGKKYEAVIRINKKKVYLGCFYTEEEAHSKYMEEYNKIMNENNILL